MNERPSLEQLPTPEAEPTFDEMLAIAGLRVANIRGLYQQESDE